MANVSVYNIEGKEVGSIELNDAVFGVEVNEHLVHMAVVNQLANNRQGTQSAKTRSEVSGGGRKPWRQKGTGHARQGSTRSPQWTGGGVVFADVYKRQVLEFVRSIGEYVTTADGKATASQMCEKFLFTPKQQWTPISKLSGGEKRRLYLLSVCLLYTSTGVP